jgi:hypothetical protein
MFERMRGYAGTIAIAFVVAAAVAAVPAVAHDSRASAKPTKVFAGFLNGPVSTTTPMTTVASLSVPAGKYAIWAKGWFNNGGPDRIQLDCRLVAGADYDQSLFQLEPGGATAVNMTAVPLEVVHQFTGAGVIELMCDAGVAVGPSANHVKIVAVKADTLSNVAL